MGGIFSGRWRSHQRKSCVEECLQLPISLVVGSTPPTVGHSGTMRWPRRKCEISFTFVTSHRLELRYRIGQETAAVRILLELIPVPTPRGGAKYQTRCPLGVHDVPCGRQVAVLYLPPQGRYFGCRTCHRLAYASQQRHDKRVTALLKSGNLRTLADNPVGQSVTVLGVVLAAIREQDRRCERELRRLNPKPKPRRRKPP